LPAGQYVHVLDGVCLQRFGLYWSGFRHLPGVEGCQPRSYRVPPLRIALLGLLPLISFTHMLHSVLNICAAFAAIATLCGFGYTVLSMWGAARFLWKREDVAATMLPPVSILKPLKGRDPEMLENFRSHCRQNYSDYEIVFGVTDAKDPAIAAVEQLRLEFPSRPIRLVVSQRSLGANAKVSNLAQMVSVASYEYVVVNDS